MGIVEPSWNRFALCSLPEFHSAVLILASSSSILGFVLNPVSNKAAANQWHVSRQSAQHDVGNLLPLPYLSKFDNISFQQAQKKECRVAEWECPRLTEHCLEFAGSSPAVASLSFFFALPVSFSQSHLRLRIRPPLSSTPPCPLACPPSAASPALEAADWLLVLP